MEVLFQHRQVARAYGFAPHISQRNGRAVGSNLPLKFLSSSSFDKAPDSQLSGAHLIYLWHKVRRTAFVRITSTSHYLAHFLY